MVQVLTRIYNQYLVFIIPLPGQATILELDAAAINPRDVELKHSSFNKLWNMYQSSKSLQKVYDV